MARVKGFRMKIFVLPSASDSERCFGQGGAALLCRHILNGVPPDQFEGAMQNMASNLLQAIAGKAYDRGILDEAAERAFVERFVQKLELSSLPGQEEEV